MNSNKNIDERIKNEWNNLGFYYDRDEQNLLWNIIGSKTGILKFCYLLEQYSTDKRNEGISEHEHYGPYSYLKFVTWAEPKITERDICGRLNDLHRLSELVRKKLEMTSGEFIIDKEFSDKNDYKIKFIIKDDDFLPASFDSSLNS